MNDAKPDRAELPRSHTTARATAPGDISEHQVEAREAALGRQFRHDNTIHPLAPTPIDTVTVSASTGDAMPVVRAAVFYTTDGTLPDITSLSSPMHVHSVGWRAETGFLTHFRAAIPQQPAGTIVRYRIGGWTIAAFDTHPDVWAQDGQGFWFTFPAERGVTTFAYRVDHPHPPLADWAESAVMYQIFLDRFHPGSPDGIFTGGTGPRDRHGGTLNGVRLSLPYLADLGVNCIWLSPHCLSETYHRYDTIDFFNLDPALGTPNEMHALVEDAHARGMRIILDFVPSHCSWHHPAFVAAQTDRSAATAEWFTFYRWPDQYRSFLDRARYLPSFDTSHPGARAHVIDAARYWLTEFDVDGFRLDHAIAPGMDFWTAFQSGTEEVRADVLNFGEATDSPDCLRRYRAKMNGILDFPLATALRSHFGRGDWTTVEFDTFLRSYDLFMADGPGRLSFLDNHDMERFLHIANGDKDRLRMAAICQFTLPPVPIVYYGTEIGMTHLHSFKEQGYGGDAEARQNMSWEPDGWDTDLLHLYRKLCRLRSAEPALRSGERYTVHVDGTRGTYAYVRPGPRTVTVVFNVSEWSQTVSLRGVHEVLLASHDGITVRGSAVGLPARSAAVLITTTP